MKGTSAAHDRGHRLTRRHGRGLGRAALAREAQEFRDQARIGAAVPALPAGDLDDLVGRAGAAAS